MSIYPVRLSEWFPKDPEDEERQRLHEAAKLCIKMNVCSVCGKKPRYQHAYGMHAIPWGYGWGEIWCSKKCLEQPAGINSNWE